MLQQKTITTRLVMPISLPRIWEFPQIQLSDKFQQMHFPHRLPSMKTEHTGMPLTKHRASREPLQPLIFRLWYRNMPRAFPVCRAVNTSIQTAYQVLKRTPLKSRLPEARFQIG